MTGNFTNRWLLTTEILERCTILCLNSFSPWCRWDCLFGDPAGNFERAEAFIADAAGRGSDLVVLPELWHSSIDLENAEAYASPVAAEAGDDGWFGRFADLARDNHVWLTGSMLEGQGDQFYNTMVLYSPEGMLAATYRKIHLFRLMKEEKYLAPGESGTMHELPWGCAGLAICYDLRFPELFRRYALEGARLMILPAAWPHPRRMHWRTLSAQPGDREPVFRSRVQPRGDD